MLIYFNIELERIFPTNFEVPQSTVIPTFQSSEAAIPKATQNLPKTLSSAPEFMAVPASSCTLTPSSSSGPPPGKWVYVEERFLDDVLAVLNGETISALPRQNMEERKRKCEENFSAPLNCPSIQHSVDLSFYDGLSLYPDDSNLALAD